VTVSGFDRYLQGVLDRAAGEARRDGSAAVEAQHLLLAIAADAGTPTADALGAVGLDRAAIRAALDREFAHSLDAVGVAPSTFGVPPATPDPRRRLPLGSSVQLTLERAVKAAAGADLRPAHLLLGILRAEVGTVPRALALAGVDRVDLAARVAQTLSRSASK
jgi:ATP-dependent Clp protease ATP-binding subunit ClpA